MDEPLGTLIAIGGHEDKEGERIVLRAVAERLGGGRLVVTTLATKEPDGYFQAYMAAFAGIGVTDLVHLHLSERKDAYDSGPRALLGDAAGIFFTGGDQLRIVNLMGGTPLETLVRELHRRGGVVAGTSAGAAMQSDTMLVRGSGTESPRVCDVRLAPGLGLIPGVIIDQHFSERGRIGRLLGAVAYNHRLLGLGIDEDTAIVVQGRQFDVVGSGAVIVVDAAAVTRSNIDETEPDRVLSIHDVVLHALSAGDRFDLDARRPQSSAR